MELYNELLINILKQGSITVSSSSGIDISEIFQSECYSALDKIKNVIQDNSLDDAECFEKIEQIICLFEKMKIDCGYRHDF